MRKHKITSDEADTTLRGEPWPKATPEVIVERHRAIPLPPGIPSPDTNSPTWAFVFAFACAMEYKLSKNRKKGDAAGWRKSGAAALQDRLDDEVEELNAALWDAVKPDKGAVLLEAADVANFAMMIADCTQNL